MLLQQYSHVRGERRAKGEQILGFFLLKDAEWLHIQWNYPKAQGDENKFAINAGESRWSICIRWEYILCWYFFFLGNYLSLNIIKESRSCWFQLNSPSTDLENIQPKNIQLIFQRLRNLTAVSFREGRRNILSFQWAFDKDYFRPLETKEVATQLFWGKLCPMRENSR